MTGIELKDILKIFPFAEVKGIFGRKKQQELLEKQKNMPYVTNEGVVVLQHVNASIQPGEFVVLLGSSGCGKTTLLRIIAGLEEPTLGQVYFDWQDVTSLRPEDRNVAIVFQNYSLYPHLSVFDNIAFTLRTQHIPREQIRATVEEMAALLGLEAYLDRLPSQLSGGQLQRVAIARALVRKPSVFLMDEPFSNLDAPLRASMRKLVKKIHAALGTTFIYVTHDQQEALLMGQRILVMRDGIILQDGTPSEIYNSPADVYCAMSLGSPQMNLFSDILPQRGKLHLLGMELDVPEDTRHVGIRPVHIALGESGTPAQVSYTEPLGSETILHLRADGREVSVVTDNNREFYRGQQIGICPDRQKFHFFDEDGNRL
jgi:multiple sugar transport system ATP-binding protein